jgi:anti-sigma regulatory factor (Ser/Thr protein kinase)
MRMLESRSQSRLQMEDVSHVGECRRTAQHLAETHEFDPTLVGRVGIVATELGNNLIRHASRGELLIQALCDGTDVTIELVAIDRGPGMHLDTCMRDGYSTAGTAGTGLGAVLRLSTLFDVYSVAGEGTVVVSRIAKRGPAGSAQSAIRNATPVFGAICLAVAGETECGDAWRIAERSNETAIMVADGLGHGPLAAAASRAAAATFSERPFEPPSEAMQRLHHTLSGGRGAAVACAVLDADKAKVVYSGVGNIAGSVINGERSKGMVSHNGTLGVQLLRKQQFEYDFGRGSRVVMHSDGMSARWAVSAYPGLFARHAAVIAAVLYRDHARARDDITVVVSGARA